MGVLNPNSTSYVHPNEPNLTRIENAMDYNPNGEPAVRVLIEQGITIQAGTINVDAVRIWDGTHTLLLDQPNNDGEAGQWSLPVENYNYVWNGTSWDRMRGNTTTGVLVNITNPTLSVTQGTTPWTVTGTVSVQSGQIVVTNFTSTVNVSNNVSATITSLPDISGTVTVGNFTSSVRVINNITATITGSVTVSNFTSTVNVASLPAITGTVTVGNFTSTVQVSNFTSTVHVDNIPTAITVTNFTSTVNINTMPSVTVSNFTSTVSIVGTPTVSVSNIPNVIVDNILSGTITVSNFTSSVRVINNVTATITGSVTVSNFPTTSTVYQGTTPWLVQTTNTATDITIADSRYEMNVARGLVDSQYVEMKNGYAPSLSPGTGANEPTVWGLDTPYPWSAWGNGQRLWIVSDNATDIGQTVFIDGLNSSYAKINETVTMNGTTGTQTTSTFLRINHMYILTGNTNAGGISARIGNATTGTQVAYMIPGYARAKGGFFTVPAGYSAYILYGDCSSYKNGSGNVSGQVDMYTRTPNQVTTPFMLQFAAVVANGQYRNEFNVPLRVPEKTDIDVRFNASGNQTTVSVNWEMILIPN